MSADPRDTVRRALDELREKELREDEMRDVADAALLDLDEILAESRFYRKVLESLEWSGFSWSRSSQCPACGNWPDDGHENDCQVGVALADQGTIARIGAEAEVFATEFEEKAGRARIGLVQRWVTR